MARTRTVKPEFWTDGKVGECSTNARLLFIGALNFADDAGGLDRSAKQLKAQVFPHDNLDCEPLIQELLSVGMLVEYQVSGNKYLHIKNFLKHQRIDKPQKARIPVYDSSLTIHEPFQEQSATVQRSKGIEGNGREGNLGVEPAAPAPKARPSKRCPDDWMPSDKLRTGMARQFPSVDVALELEKLRDHTFATARSDWDATFRNWIRKAAEQVRGFKRPETPKPAECRHGLPLSGSGCCYCREEARQGRSA